MRILAGKYKGRRFEMPKGIRPTQDKVRKALFDTLGDLEGVSFLELFAGSGAVGFEAASRGASPVLMVEQAKESLLALRKNLSTLGISCCDILPWDAEGAVVKLHKEKRSFDVVFLDPPYYREMAKKTLQLLDPYDIVAPDGLVVIQHYKKDDLPDTLGVLSLLRRSTYGDTLLSYYRKQGKPNDVPESDISRDV